MYLRLTGSLPVRIDQVQENFRRRAELDLKIYLQESILVLLIQLGLNKKVLNVTLNWDCEKGDIPKDSYKDEPDSPRFELRDTNRTTTDENTEVSILFSRHKFDTPDKSKQQKWRL